MPSLTATMTVACIDQEYGIGVTEIPVPALPPQGALIKVVGCGVCGSDLDKFVHKKSSPGSILGHEMVGIIEALDEGHPGDWEVGDRLVSSHHAPCGTCHYCLWLWVQGALDLEFGAADRQVRWPCASSVRRAEAPCKL